MRPALVNERSAGGALVLEPGQAFWGLGFGVWGLGLGVWGWGFRVWGLGFGV